MEGVVAAALVEVLHGTAALPPHPLPPHPGPWILWIWKQGACCRALPIARYRKKEFSGSLCALKYGTQRAGGALRCLQQQQGMGFRQQLLPS